jgi:hypothetical protein
MKKHQIERKNKSESRGLQRRQLCRDIHRKVAFIEALGSKATLRRMDFVINTLVRIGAARAQA